MRDLNQTPISLAPALKQKLFNQFCEQLEDAITILDSELKYLYVNPSYEQMVGYEESFLLGRPLGIYDIDFLSNEQQQLLKDIGRELCFNGSYKGDFSVVMRFGHTVNCRTTFKKITVDGSTYYVGITRDMSEDVSKKKYLTHLINHDELTNLPSRKVFLAQFSELLMDTYDELVVVRLNIDRYRSLASQLGSEDTDALVKDFVQRVNDLELDNLRAFSRFGGDDFALLFECSNANIVRNQLDRLMQEFERPYFIQHAHEANENNDKSTAAKPIYYRISLGVSYFPTDGAQFATLLTKAEKALNYVKHNGGDDICWFNDAVNTASTNHMQLESELREAIQKGQLIPYYQPKVAIDTGDITGFEALVRWQHPTRGLLDSADFIDAIISLKLSFELFSQMAVQIAQQLSLWQTLEFSQHICINADASEFSHPEFSTVVKHLFDHYTIHPHQLHIEVTESSLIQRHATVDTQLNSLKALGICLALDDFGTGYASLSYLQQYPFDFIKIDKSFITNIAFDTKQQAIVKAILDLSDALDIQVIAEGIETKAQRDLLADMGCKYGQGYWFSKPVSAEAATKMLARNTKAQ